MVQKNAATQTVVHQEAIECLYLVAEDCKVPNAVEPSSKLRNDKKTNNRITWEVLHEAPYAYDAKKLKEKIHLEIRGRTDLKLEAYNIRKSKMAQCFGWGIHQNSEGKLALVAMESEKYQQLKNNIRTVATFRNKKKIL